MEQRPALGRSRRNLRCLAALATFLLCAANSFGQDTHPAQEGSTPPSSQPPPSSKDQKKDQNQQKSSDPATTKIRIHVTDPNGKPVSEASVYVRYNETSGLFHKDKLAELSFKTNQEGSLKVPEVPQGKVLIQVIAKGWHTFGKWYDMDKDEVTVDIKLEQPPHWY